MNACFNSTSEPSINLTSTGLLAMAYTAYANSTPCPGMRANTTTLVGFTGSSDLGATWSPPVYLGNPDCADSEFADAAQPSLTSLANGTLVLVYEEYNLTNTSIAPAPTLVCSDVDFDRIVATESFDNGSTWTLPTVLDSVTANPNGSCPAPGFPDLQPWVAATGQTIYVAWTNFTYPFSCCSPYGTQAAITLRASTDGGATWGTPSALPILESQCPTCSPTSTNGSMNPELLVLPNGTLDVAYLTGLGYAPGGWCAYCSDAELVLASSSDNGSSFSLHVVDNSVFLWTRCCEVPVFEDPTPALAFSASTGQTFVAWASQQPGTWCNPVAVGTDCFSGGDELVTVANSSDGGATWTNHSVESRLVSPNFGLSSPAWNPSLAVTSDGVVHLQFTFSNESICYAAGSCGAFQQLAFNTADNGTTWEGPFLVTLASTLSPYGQDPMWTGQYSTMLAVGSDLFLGWTEADCAGAATGAFCDGVLGTPANTTVVLSRSIPSAGLTVSFVPIGLPASLGWSVDVMGNLRTGASNTSLSVSGVPSGETVAFTVPWVNDTWGVAYVGRAAPPSPHAFVTNATVNVTFGEYVALTIATAPSEPADAFLVPANNGSNFGVLPSPGVHWLAVGSPVVLNASIQALSIACGSCLDLAFLAWSGAGNGSLSTLSPVGSFTLAGPVNETAVFAINGWCSYNNFTSSMICSGPATFPLTFNETGLPNGALWSVTVMTSNGTLTTESTTGSALAFAVTENLTFFWVWNVPDPSAGAGWSWIPGTSRPSPVEAAGPTEVEVNFTLGHPTGTAFATEFEETGLPDGTPWTLALDNRTWGMSGNASSLTLAGGGPYVLTAPNITLGTGLAYLVTEVSVVPFVENETAFTLLPGGTLYLNGSALVTLSYRSAYLLTTAAGVGGTVEPGSEWVTAGSSVVLAADPNPGFDFAGWTGIGSGATSGGQALQLSPTITPEGPVTEFAAFRPVPAVTWNLTVVPIGLPAGATYAIGLGGVAYASEGGVFTIGGLATGEYALSAPTVYLNASNGTRFVASHLAATNLSLSSGNVLTVDANGTLTVTYQGEALVVTASTPAGGGTVTPAPGTAWEPVGSTVTFSAIPTPGYQFLGWNVTELGVPRATGGAANFSLTIEDPVVATAEFAPLTSSAPATFSLQVTETGLPSGLAWNVTLGTSGRGATTPTIVLTGLNGSYPLAIPTVSVGGTTRYVANLTPTTESVRADLFLTVSFAKQFLVVVSGGVGGTVSPTGPTWVDAGASLTITAVANATSEFVNWSGGALGYSGPLATTVLNVSGPIVEDATFTPSASPSSGTSSSSPAVEIAISFGLLVVLLVVGIVVGRRSRREKDTADSPRE